ncbi:coiled-coil-helix-coiled-coil-helix domain-containing protein 7 isoform X2 [Sander vitreus]
MDKKAGNVRNQDINPCIEESDASQKCLNAYNYDKSMCSAYFQRYKSCRKYWTGQKSSRATEDMMHAWEIDHGTHNIMLQRRRDGVKPDMPTAAERQEMLATVGGKPY